MGYVERERLSLRSSERGILIQGSLCSHLKRGGFLWHFWVHRKGVGRKGTSLASLEGEGVVMAVSGSSPLKRGVVFGTFGCTGKGYVERGNFSRFVR